ncbi:penicillin acylase family protein [Flavihumibacter petaseus]|uniref:Putative hydrolase n=1 Tax=Flavihumibacter petaseus NBRC 106054 TaxID=1220578 RepID=A0A0E9N1N0_9BACT|nr:penicillin acylase family protein [Flavihumibacter petaseus]GAO43536.1 putative hydrolase [Flavihumibacter petaseus NBRC 106054]
MIRWTGIILVFLGCSGGSGNHGTGTGSGAGDSLVTRADGGQSRAEIYRDKWGIQHVYGETDAAAVYGLIWSQCQDDFASLEEHYIERLGRQSEVYGKEWLYADLLIRLQYDSTDAQRDYQQAPPEMKQLLDAFAAAVNDYLGSQDTVQAQLLSHFEPWYPLLFPDGSYTGAPSGGLTVNDIRSLYPLPEVAGSAQLSPLRWTDNIPTGSNGFAVNGKKTIDGAAMLFINPHTSFYYRTEAQVASGEGLNAYGAVTWGQFFVYQGFNRHCGWMHTSSQADAADLYAEAVTPSGSEFVYRYDRQTRPVAEKKIVLRYREKKDIKETVVRTFRTHHGPVVGARNGKWLSLRMPEQGLKALAQSWLRMKADGLKSFTTVLNLRTNTSTNTVYADDSGNIAYWHGNGIARRDPEFDWSSPIDGSIAATEWKGQHELNELIHFLNPPGGWLQNCNSSGFTAAGRPGLSSSAFPGYMSTEGENFRSLHLQQLLQAVTTGGPETFQHIGFDRRLSAFDSLLPPLFQAWDARNKSGAGGRQPDSSAGNKTFDLSVAEAIDSLRRWNREADTNSVATTIAIEWAGILFNLLPQPANAFYDQEALYRLLEQTIPPETQLKKLEEVISFLQRHFGTWKIQWGSINRFQRQPRGEPFLDDQPSVAVPFAPGLFGCLPAFETTWQGTKKGYGIAGNSFVALVHFSKPLRAWSSFTGGHAEDPRSAHFTDQVELLQKGKLKDVIFLPGGRKE